MKKLLGIVVLGLLVYSTVFAGEIKPLNKVVLYLMMAKELST